MTLDELLTRATELRSVWSGEIPVAIETYIGYHLVDKVEVRRIYTSNEKLEQPCPVVMIGDIV